jgi:hypothetical protein
MKDMERVERGLFGKNSMPSMSFMAGVLELR